MTITQVERAEEVGILGAIRQALGAEDEVDETYDAKINGLSNSQLISLWCQWELGSKTWWISMKSYFDHLESIK